MNISYQLKKLKRAKHIRIRVKPNLQVIVTAPLRASSKVIEKAVYDSEAWITQQQIKVSTAKKKRPLLDMNNHKVAYQGSIYNLKIEIQKSQPKINIAGKTMIINPITGNKSDAEKTLIQWLRYQAVTAIEPLVAQWAHTMGVTPSRISYRQQTSRWGSCTGKGHLSFNWRLIHATPKAMEYVVIHELAHIKLQNHSKAYWELVASYCPGYKTYKAELSEYLLEVV